MNKRHYEHTLPNIRGSLSNTYRESTFFRKYVLKKLLRENKNINYLLLGLNEKNGSYSNLS